MDNNITCIKKVYEFLEKTTPVKYDCGKICDKKCCKGERNDGMLLFPGEEEIFRDNDNFNIYYDVRYECNAIICNGPCDRNERPLSCRIFPYFIYSDNEKGKLSVAPDIRAIDFCPLLAEKYELDRNFLRTLRISALKLSENQDMIDFVKKITKKLTDFNGLGE